MGDPPRYDYDAVVALTDEQGWSEAGITSPEGIRLCWDAGFDASTIHKWTSAVLYVLSGGRENAIVPLAEVVAVAQTWKAAGFTPEQAQAWSRVSLNIENAAHLVHEARRWRAAGFDPDAARQWRQSGVLEAEQDLEFAVLFANQDWHPMHAALLGILLSRYAHSEYDQRRRDWLALELGPETTLNYVKAGVTCDQARAFESLSLQPRTLEAELQARYEQLPPLDTFLAVHFNHICYGEGRDEHLDDEELPFYARHIWDRHDERRERKEQADKVEWLKAANSAGQRLIAVVEVGDDVSEDTDAQAAFTMRQAAIQAAVDAGGSRSDLTVRPERLGYHCIATGPDGRGFAAVIDVVQGSGFSGRREPTEAEADSWAGAPPPND